MGFSLSPAHTSSKFRPSPSPPHHPLNTSSFPAFPSPFAGPVPVLTAVCDGANPHMASMSCCHVSCSSGSRVHPLGLLDETIARRRLSTLDLNPPEKRTPPQPLRKHFHVYPSWEFGCPVGWRGNVSQGIVEVRAASVLVGFPGARLLRQPPEDLQDPCPWECSPALS